MSRMVCGLIILFSLLAGAAWANDMDFTAEYSFFNFSTQREHTGSVRYYDENAYVFDFEVLPDGRSTLLVNGHNNHKHGCRTTIFRFAADGTKQWSYVHDETINDIAVAPDGAVYAISASYGRDYYLIRFAPEGEVQWDLLIPDPDNHYAYAKRLEIAPNGDVVFAGRSLYGDDVSLVTGRVDADGNLLWLRLFKPTDDAIQAMMFDMALDADGNVVMIGYYKRVISFIILHYYLTFAYDGQGNLLWSEHFFLPYPRVIEDENHVAFDDEGQAIVAFALYDNETDVDVLLMKYSPDGDLLWQHQMTEPENQYYYALAVDEDGEFLLAGQDYLSGKGVDRLRLIKVDAEGELVWSNSFLPGQDISSYANHLDLNADGEVIATGATCADECRYAVLYYDDGGSLLTQILLDPVDPMEGAGGLFANFIDSGALVLGYADNEEVNWDDFPENDCELPYPDDDVVPDDDDTTPDDDDDATPDDDSTDDAAVDDDAVDDATPGDDDDPSTSSGQADDDDDDGCGC